MKKIVKTSHSLRISRLRVWGETGIVPFVILPPPAKITLSPRIVFGRIPVPFLYLKTGNLCGFFEKITIRIRGSRCGQGLYGHAFPPKEHSGTIPGARVTDVLQFRCIRMNSSPYLMQILTIVHHSLNGLVR